MKSVEQAHPPATGERGAAQRLSHFRWVIVALLFLSTVINYLDRQNLSILARTIQDDLRISDIEYSYVVQAFLLAYTLTYIFAGRFTDRMGTRMSMACFVIWWSISDMLTSLSRGLISLGLFRFLLGVGEPGNYTAAPKAVSEWFPPKERGLVIGIYTAGATLGATIAPPLIAYLAANFHWRAVFLATGSLGLLWVIPWLLIYRKPEEHPRVSPGELAYIKSGTVAELEEAAQAEHPWREVLRRKETWLLMFGRLITDPVWYFYLFWFPKYLTDARHMTLAEVGRVAWMVYLAADIGCIIGGWLSGWFIRRGVAPVNSRLYVMAVAAVLLPLSPFIYSAQTPLMAVLIASVAAFAHLSWQISLSTIIVDVFPKPLLGTVFGVVAAGSGFGGMLSANLIGRAITSWSYAPVFLAMGFLHPLAFVMLQLVKPKKARR